MRKIIMVLTICFCMIAVAACSSGSATSTNDTAPAEQSANEVQTTETKGQTIGEEEAKAIALKHAGLKESEVTFALAHLDMDDGIQAYDVEFYKDGKEYDYEIDAYSGDIISYDFDMESKVAQPENNSAASNASGTSNQKNVTAKVSLEKAKSIALGKAGLSEKDVTFTESSFEYDDGYEVYQIDFVSGDMEYEMEIDANTGDILEYDSESIYD